MHCIKCLGSPGIPAAGPSWLSTTRSALLESTAARPALWLPDALPKIGSKQDLLAAARRLCASQVAAHSLCERLQGETSTCGSFTRQCKSLAAMKLRQRRGSSPALPRSWASTPTSSQTQATFSSKACTDACGRETPELVICMLHAAQHGIASPPVRLVITEHHSRHA